MFLKTWEFLTVLRKEKFKVEKGEIQSVTCPCGNVLKIAHGEVKECKNCGRILDDLGIILGKT